MQLPYLEGERRERFDHWLERAVARSEQTLTFSEVRKGVQALVRLHADLPADGISEARLTGRGKRAALATYFAALHFLIASHALEMAPPGDGWTPGRVIDLGCGAGACGAAAVLHYGGSPRLLGIDRARWALALARETWEELGVRGRAVGAELPRELPRCGRGDLLVCGWLLSEMPKDSGPAMRRQLVTAARRGARLFVLEALAAEPVAEWWAPLREELALHGVREEMIRVAIERPPFVQLMDKAARLDHQVIGARVLTGGEASR